MPHRPMRRFSIASLCLLLVFTFAISSCGKKGPLYMPPAGNASSQK